MSVPGGVGGQGSGYDVIVHNGVEYRINRNPTTNPDGATEYAGWQAAGIDLSNRDLSRGRFAGANFRGADFSNTDLSSAELSGADLRETVLHGAILNYATLINAKLAGAKMNQATQIDNADFSGTVLGPNPNGVNVAVRGNKLVLANVPVPPGYLPGPNRVEGVRSLGCWGKTTPDLPFVSVRACRQRELPKFAGKWPAVYRLTTAPFDLAESGPEGDSSLAFLLHFAGFALTLVSGIPAEAG